MTSTVHINTKIGIEMAAHGLDPEWVIRVVALASQSEGVSDMLLLWEEFAADEAERAEVVADLDEALSDSEGAMVRGAVRSMSQAELELGDRRALKEHWRVLVERAGGVSAVARASGIPQPSLSRMLGDLSKPRASTVEKLARGLGVAVERLQSAPVVALPQPARAQRSQNQHRPSPKMMALTRAKAEKRSAAASPLVRHVQKQQKTSRSSAMAAL